MPCNPSIGGTAKGIIVREIDALGGIIWGAVADQSHFQIKMLNNAERACTVRSLRAQADKIIHTRRYVLETLRKNQKSRNNQKEWLKIL